MTEQTEATQTLAEELQRAFDAAKEPEAVEAVKEEAVEPEEEAAEEQDSSEEQEAEETTEDEFPLIPNEMSDAEKEAFQALLDSDDPEKRVAAEILIERYNSLKKGFYKKTEDYSKATKELKDIQQVFAPFEQQFKSSGITKAQYLQNMVQWEQALHTQPVDAVKQIMQTFGVKPEQLGVSSEKVDYDEDFAYDEDNKLAQRIDALEKRNQQLESLVANQPVQAQLESFKNATDPQGNLKHPHFEEVKQFMGTLIQSGKAQTLEDAYSKAIRVIVDESSEPKDVVDVDSIRLKVAKSKRAAKSVKTAGSRPDFSKMTVEQELAARLKMSNS